MDLPYTQCASEEPISGVRCLLPANHDGHRNGGTAWATDHDAWRAEIDAKDAEIEQLAGQLDDTQCELTDARLETSGAEETAATAQQNALHWQERAQTAEERLDGQAWDDLTAERDQLKRERDRLSAELQDVHHRIDRQVKRGDRLTEQVRNVRLLGEHWAKLAESGDWGDSIPDTITADRGRDVLAALDQPGDQESL